MIQESDGLRGTDWQPVDLGIAWSFARAAIPGQQINNLIEWCRDYEGYGKFYHDTMFNLFYFERDEDREMFLLRWS